MSYNNHLTHSTSLSRGSPARLHYPAKIDIDREGVPCYETGVREEVYRRWGRAWEGIARLHISSIGDRGDE